MTTHKVTLWPLGVTVEVSEEKSLLQSLKENGHQIKSSCGGVASCSDCIIKILSGEDNLIPPAFAEIKLLGNVFHITKERLSCQTKITGDVTIDISRHDQSPGGDRVTPKPFRPRTPTKLRKKEFVEGIKEQGESEKEKNRQMAREKKENPSWYRHWEKDKNEPSGKGKSLGGGRRPRPFRYNNDEGSGHGGSGKEN